MPVALLLSSPSYDNCVQIFSKVPMASRISPIKNHWFQSARHVPDIYKQLSPCNNRIICRLCLWNCRKSHSESEGRGENGVSLSYPLLEWECFHSYLFYRKFYLKKHVFDQLDDETWKDKYFWSTDSLRYCESHNISFRNHKYLIY